MHGAVEYYRDKNLINETERLDEKLVQLVRPLLNYSPLIVIGYRGAEPSIMRHLLEEGVDDCGGYRNGIYWCVRRGESLHENVLRLREHIGTNLRVVEIEGFDEVMAALDRELEGKPGTRARAILCPSRLPGAPPNRPSTGSRWTGSRSTILTATSSWRHSPTTASGSSCRPWISRITSL